MLENTYTLENGIKIPKLGLGTWFIDDSKVAEAVREADTPACQLGSLFADITQHRRLAHLW